ncbi:MAG TPA: hypothetical protein VMO52_06050 [Acidimicrobiia bacterium]|nr:hypothetical protein [Acidimicrobiia bacterium]
MNSLSTEDDGLAFDGWDSEEDDSGDPASPGWRRPLVVLLVVLVAVSLAILPLQSLFDGSNPPIADNGLEICGYDYCTVREAVAGAGLDLEVSRLANTLLDDDQAAELADELTRFLGIDDVEVTVVDELGGRLGGLYDPAARSVLIERPANAWVVAHEVAHAVAPGHGDEFVEVLLVMVAFMTDLG